MSPDVSEMLFYLILASAVFIWTAYRYIYGVLKKPQEFLKRYYTSTSKMIFGEDFALGWYLILGVVFAILGAFSVFALIYFLITGRVIFVT
ncbi:MAG: hypothetical protein K0R84_326 [Clostridia bacterium]|jgi:hypothetical protein|nr:hypothetical protein [Clostridia bacterium]